MTYRLLLTGVAVFIGVCVLAFGALWFFVLRGNPPPPASLQSAANVPATDGGAATAAALPGTWTIANGSNSFAGYRVNENLALFGVHPAVGRTTGVEGSLVYDGHAVTSAQVTADLALLTSDQPLRDDTLKMQAIQSCSYPTATFALTSPIPLSGSPSEGTPVATTVQGNLTLHGVTRPVAIAVKGQFTGGRLVVVGSTTVAFVDYGITQPRSFNVVSLDDHGTMEFQLAFSKASAPSAPSPEHSVTPVPGCTRGGPPPNGSGGSPGGGFPTVNPPGPVPSPVGP